VGFGGRIGLEDDLSQTGPVPEIDEDDPPVVSPAVDPATEHRLLSDVTGAELSAVEGSSETPQGIQTQGLSLS
jgi:hypothetical protein